MTEEKAPRELNLTDAQFEHTIGILSEVDLTPLVDAFQGSLIDLLRVLPMLGQARELRIFRRLEAIWAAEPEDLEGAEADAANMERLERKAARTPFNYTLEGLKSFFGGLGLSLSDTREFLERGKAVMTEEGMSPDPKIGLSHSEG